MIRSRWTAMAAGVVALLVLHLVLVRPVHGFLLSDTTGYLANARWIAGKAGYTWQGPSSFYHPGWSLIVAPLYLLFDLPRDVQLGALVLNALLAAALLPACYLLGRRAFDLPPRLALVAGAVASTYPAVLLLAGYEWGEALYQLLFVLFVVSTMGTLTRATVPWAAAMAATATALNATHPRGLGVVAVAGVAIVVLGLTQRLSPAATAVGLGTLLALFLATRLLDAALLDAIYARKSAAVEGDVLGRLTDLGHLKGMVKAGIGQVWYLTVATFGLVPLGMLWLATTRRVGRPVAIITIAAVLATFGASVLEMSDGTRVDHMVYGRYMEGVVPVLLVAGCAAIAAWRTFLPILLAGAMMLATALAVVLVGVRGGEVFTGNVMPLNVTGILVWRDSISHVDVARVTILTLLATAVVFGVARWRALAGLAVATVLFAGSAASVQARTLRPFDEQWAGFTRIPEVVRVVGDGSPVTYDRAAYDLEPADIYQLELSDLGVRFGDSRTGRLPTTALVISTPVWPTGEQWGARLVTVEVSPVYEQALWVLPGALQKRLERAGALVPDDLLAPLPDRAQRQRVDVDARREMSTNQTTWIDVEVHHAGGASAWLPGDAIHGVVAGTVRLGARWFDADGNEVASQTADLDRVVRSGESAHTDLPLTTPPKPGRYRLTIGLRQEGVTWFPGGRTFTVVVR